MLNTAKDIQHLLKKKKKKLSGLDHVHVTTYFWEKSKSEIEEILISQFQHLTKAIHQLSPGYILKEFTVIHTLYQTSLLRKFIDIFTPIYRLHNPSSFVHLEYGIQCHNFI